MDIDRKDTNIQVTAALESVRRSQRPEKNFSLME